MAARKVARRILERTDSIELTMQKLDVPKILFHLKISTFNMRATNYG